MDLFKHQIFEHFKLEELPLRRDLFLVDQKHAAEWSRCWAEHKGEGNDDNIFVDFISIEKVDAHSLELRWFINISTRYHAVQIILPRDKVMAAVGINGYDEKIHLFVESDWLTELHSRLYTVFGMVDAIGMKQALQAGAIKKDTLVSLRTRIDKIATEHPEIAFISFADSVLLKGNWSVSYVRKGAPQTYKPEVLIQVFAELSAAIQAELKLPAYGVLTQGSNEFYESELLHLAGPKNHIGMNALGAPFAQLLEIEHAVKVALKEKSHPAADLYMDQHFFSSLNFKSYEYKEKAPRASYYSKIMASEGLYFYAKHDDIVAQLEPAN